MHVAEARLVVVYQEGFQDTRSILEKFLPVDAYVISLNGSHLSPLANMNRNRILGYRFCFEALGSEVVAAVEDDVLISPDALRFIREMHHRYGSRATFRGVNLGSRIAKGESDQGGYSLLRYGMHGQAGSIGLSSWRRIRRISQRSDWQREPFDSTIEAFMKSGFVVTPNVSRALDTGWDGTHAPQDSSSPVYERQKASWIGLDTEFVGQYARDQKDHRSWRDDVREYRPFDAPAVAAWSRRMYSLGR
jgi:hypothetical protein